MPLCVETGRCRTSLAGGCSGADCSTCPDCFVWRLRVSSIQDSVPAHGIAGGRFKQFILTHITDSFQERVQVTETSAKSVINFFGSRMQALPIGGMLKNSAENPWTTNMVYLWEKYMSGSMLAEMSWIAEFYCNHVLYKGYPINFNMSVGADRDIIAQFDMQLAVWERTPQMVSGASYAPLNVPAHITWPPNLPNVDATDPDMSPGLNWPSTPPPR